MKTYELAVPCRLKAASIISEKQPQVAPGDAYKAGFEAGYKEGRWRAELELRREREALGRKFGDRLAALDRIHESLVQLSQQHLPSLVLAAVTRLFQHHRFSDDEIFSEVSSLLKDLSQASRIRIEANPEDLKALRTRIEEAGVAVGSAAVEWVANSALHPGEFTLHSDLGSIDGRRQARLQQLRLVLES
jgi:flagellar biosynthesis/type III secretory pathway protein FliH